MSDYTDQNFTSSDWGLIQDCIVDQISHLTIHGLNVPFHKEEVERLEKMLERVGRKYAQTRVN